MGPALPPGKGFEQPPRGFLLEQVIDLRGDMGIAYERAVDFYKDFHTHDRVSFVFPRGGCTMEITTRARRGRAAVDSHVMLMLPRGHPHEIRGRSSVFDAIALYPAPTLLDRVAGADGIPSDALDRFRRTVRTLRRSLWLDQLLVEYFSRRILAAGGPERGELRFFETEITREVLCLAGLGPPRRRRDEAARPAERVSDRALQFIEANLFGSLALEAIASYAHASVSTLLRHFAARTGLTPLRYARRRRLDEARALLKQGARNVTEVAMLVGYENVGAFSEAFRAKFGQPPSRTRPRRPPKGG